MPSVRRVAAARALWDAWRGAKRADGFGVGERFRAVPRMVAMSLTRRYPHLAWRRLLLLALGVVYVLSPVDFVPELFLPVLGLGDDALVVLWLAGAVLAETDAFLRWERERGRAVVVGEVVS